jgi:hypothetical protein
MTGADWGWIGGLAGGVLGTLGGVVGSWASIRSARPGTARRFMIAVVAGMWAVLALAGTLIVLAANGVLPAWVIWATQGVFFVALGPAILLLNRRARRLDRD